MRKVFLGLIVLSSPILARGPSDPLPSSTTLTPSNSVWQTDITSAPVSSSSTIWIDVTNGHAGHNFHANFGSSALGDGSYNGIPYNLVWSTTTARKTVPLSTYATESDTPPVGGVPIPSDVIAENDIVGSTHTVGGDQHLLLVDVSSGMVYEMFGATRVINTSNWTAAQLTIWNSTSNITRPSGITSADAAGLQITQGLLRYEEVSPTCNINHAIRMELSLTHGPYIWPASHDANSGGVLNPPFGMRVRMKSSVDLSVLSDTTSICIFNALKKYGAILADNGGDWFIDGVPNAGWNDTNLHNDFIDVGLPLNTMEVVDESTWMISTNTYQAVHPSTAPTLSLVDSGTGINETITVESSFLFRLVFEADDNWGLSQWYDLVNDPKANTNLAGPLYSVNGPSDPCFAEPGLQNMTLYGDGDAKAQMREAGCNFSTSERSMSIVYQSTGLVVLQTLEHPMDAIPDIDTNVVITHRYYILPNGKVYDHNTLQTLKALDLGAGGTQDLFVATMGLEDPTQTGTVPPDSIGWIRAAADQNPYSFSSSQENYVFAYWSAATTGTYAGYTDASIMEIASPNNPTSLLQIIHSWGAGPGFGVVRWGYRQSPGPNMTAGQTITNEFLMQLGTQNSTVLPNIINSTVGDSIANPFIASPTFPTIPGVTSSNPSFTGNGTIKGNGTVFSR